MIDVYLTGDQSQIDMSVAEALYVRPFHAETAKEVPQISAHCVVDPRKKIMSVEVVNVWPTPIEIQVDAPVAIVDTVNPDLQYIPQPKLNPVPDMGNGGKETERDVAAWWNWEAMDDDSDENEAIPMPAPFTAPKTDPPPDEVFIAPPTEIPKEAVTMETMDEYPDDEAQPTGNFAEGEDPEDVILEEVEKEEDRKPPDIPIFPSSEEPGKTCEDPSEEKAEKKGDEFEINFVGCVFQGENREKFKRLCEKYDCIFSKSEKDLGKTDMYYHSIDLTTERPIYAPNYRTVPPHVQKDITRETDKLMASGCLRESDSPYSAPIVLVKKKLGGWRYCTDFRRLNKVTVKQNFPLPHIEDSIRRLNKPKIFSCLDLTKGFHQLQIIESCRRYYAFSDGRRHLEYVRVPMGAKNSSASMQCLMELVMRGLPIEYLLVYMDDLLIATPTEEKHLEMLERVFDALARAGLKVHPGKCTFANTSATTLGYLMDSSGLKPDPRNLGKIRDWPPPKDVTGVRAYLGLLNY